MRSRMTQAGTPPPPALAGNKGRLNLASLDRHHDSTSHNLMHNSKLSTLPVFGRPKIKPVESNSIYNQATSGCGCLIKSYVFPPKNLQLILPRLSSYHDAP